MEKNIWEKAKINIREKNPSNHILLAWINQVNFIKIEPLVSGRQKIHLSVPSTLCRDRILDNFTIINEEISNIHKQPLEAEIHVQEHKNKEQPKSTSLASHQVEFSPVVQLPQDNVSPGSPDKDYLNPYTFDNFVVGRNSEFAHGACYSVAQSPGKGYNPLFIYGPTGIGKTHLLHATGRYIQENFPDLRIKYVSAEKFLNECVASIRHRKMDEFKKRYREECHVLLMDDIQSFGKGEATQEEFFNTLNFLFENKRQVVVASDCMPKDIKGLEERIRTRLEWGVIADIHMPDLETRIAIVKSKAEEMNVHIPDDTLEFLARISKHSVRELEGNLKRVKVHKEIRGVSTSLKTVQAELFANYNTESVPIRAEDIQNMVAHHYKIKLVELKSQNRSKPIATARQVAMFLMKKYLKDKSLKDIGRAFNKKDHSTVIHAIKKISTMKNYEIKKDIENLSKSIESQTE